MNTVFKILFCVLLFLSVNLNASYAADSLGKQYPTAVLVQLRSEHARIAALTRDKMYRELEEVKNDAQEVMKRMILDFHNNFDYCPVYYYIDTNADLVKNKQFDGILLHEDGSPVKNPVINSKSDDYLIAYYGYPLSQSRLNEVLTDTPRYSYDPQTTNAKGLVLLNDKFLQLTYFYKYDYDNLFFGRAKWAKKYYYNSRHFFIEYYPFAGLFSRTMLNRYGHRRIQVLPSDLK